MESQVDQLIIYKLKSAKLHAVCSGSLLFQNPGDKAIIAVWLTVYCCGVPRKRQLDAECS